MLPWRPSPALAPSLAWALGGSRGSGFSSAGNPARGADLLQPRAAALPGPQPHNLPRVRKEAQLAGAGKHLAVNCFLPLDITVAPFLLLPPPKKKKKRFIFAKSDISLFKI